MFRFPLNQGRISSPFGNRKSGFHRGVDIATARGTPIYAAASGTVRTRGYSSSYGYYIVLEHSDGYSTLYAHVSSIADSVRVGKQVVRGQVIAWVGSTGFSTGPHLHWEVSRHGQLVNPMNFFGN
jgi:murein DD-endopeptidase MepM/ murein hydrolase activator NlpD